MIKVMGESVSEQIQSIDNILVSMMRHDNRIPKTKGAKYIVPFFCSSVKGDVDTIFVYAPTHQQTITEGRIYITNCEEAGVMLECIAIGEQTRKFSQLVKKGDNHFMPKLTVSKDDIVYFNMISTQGQTYPVGIAGTIEGEHICI